MEEICDNSVTTRGHQDLWVIWAIKSTLNKDEICNPPGIDFCLWWEVKVKMQYFPHKEVASHAMNDVMNPGKDKEAFKGMSINFFQESQKRIREPCIPAASCFSPAWDGARDFAHYK